MILKMVDDRKTIFVLYILTRMKTRFYDCSTYSGSCIVHEGAGCKCTRTFSDIHCTTLLFKDERETKLRDRRIVDTVYKSICQHSMRYLYMKEEDDCRVTEKITKRRKNNDDQLLLHQKIF